MASKAQSIAFDAIETALIRHPEGLSAKEILNALAASMPLRTLQYRLKSLFDNNRLAMVGEGRAAKYRLQATLLAETPLGKADKRDFPLSTIGVSIRNDIQKPFETRKPVGYNGDFLDRYRPNSSFYLTEQERAHLAAVGHSPMAQQQAGTYAKHILKRLLIDLAWNSSRLEGNTYSLLDTKRLIEWGEEATDHTHLEAQMILNHKDAIEFLVTAADDIAFDRYTILNLHALLANNLLADPSAAGRLRYIPIGIERSVFHPLESPQLIGDYSDQILATANAITDPFEQAFFIMVQLPYLQPFDDVNERVSRLAANIPFIKHNLSPLSFTDLPEQLYIEAILGVYELNKPEMLKDIFIWAYERSAARYGAVRQSLGEPDPFRLRYREQLREITSEIVRSGLTRTEAAVRIKEWATKTIPADDRSRITDIIEAELVGLHEGNFARYRIRPSEFTAWQQAWVM